MNKKISLPELIDLVTKGSNYKKKEIELFLTDLFELIEERIYQDGLVKIKGLGVFKLIEIEERKSVNVNSGSEIIIPAHHKLTFTPDADLKAAISDNILKDEPVNDYTIPVVEYVEEQSEEPSDPKEDSIEPEIEVVVELPEDIEDRKQEPIMPHPDPKHHAFLTEEVEHLKRQLSEAQLLLHIPNKKPSFWWGLFAGILFMSSVGYICWYAGLFNLIPDPVSVENMHEDRGLESAEPAMSDADLQKLNKPISTDLDTVTFSSGMNLFKLSTKYYGHRIFWVYIFDANRGHLASPNHIKIGTEIIIPKLDSTLIDIDNMEVMSKAQKLQSEYYLKYNLGQ